MPPFTLLITLLAGVIGLTGCDNNTPSTAGTESKNLAAADRERADTHKVADDSPSASPQIDQLSPSPSPSVALAESMEEDEISAMIGSVWGLKVSPSADSENQSDAENSDTDAEEPTMEVSPTPATTASPKLVRAYKDGHYSATGGYDSPAGKELIEVELVLKDGIIMNVNIVPQSKNETSLKMQEAFGDGIGLQVIGKKLDEMPEITNVNGSSLVSQGFMRSLNKIRNEAL